MSGVSGVSGVEWSGVEWSGVEWSGVEWSGVEWSGVNSCIMSGHTETGFWLKVSYERLEGQGVDFAPLDW